ncbi:MAG TPA: hypothetical protein VI032_01450 [Burkholderiaceae bacterium]
MSASAALFSLERARGSRPAGGHFHLRAQMKVTKAKGLKTDLTGLYGNNPRTASVRLKRSLAADAMYPRKSVLQDELVLYVGCCHGSETDRIEPLCFGYFHLGPQMKVARPPAETGGLSRSERARP